MLKTRAWAGDRRPSFQDYLSGLLSTHMRDDWETGCPMAASASEIGRHGCAVSASFTQAFEQMAVMIKGSLEDAIPPYKRRSLAIAAVVAEIGAIAVSRAVAKTDPALADEVLEAVRETVGAAHELEKASAE
jgi:TetR/AcrR family transcriptional repressor of nem operon